MKGFLIICLTFCTTHKGLTQPIKPSIEFKGGEHAFTKFIVNNLEKYNGLYAKVPMGSLREGNQYFIVLMKMNKKGMFGNNCSILSIQDTLNSKVILNAIKQTDGQWINHTGVDKTVILPFYYIYRDDSNRQEKEPSLKNYFHSANKTDIICLEPYVIVLYPGVR